MRAAAIHACPHGLYGDQIGLSDIEVGSWALVNARRADDALQPVVAEANEALSRPAESGSH